MAASIVTPVDMQRAVACLRAGGIVAYPTETFYGLAVDPFIPGALARLFAVKGRSASKAVLVLIDGAADLPRLAAAVPDVAARVMARFWPGAVTIVLPAVRNLPPLLTGGSGSIGVRVSSAPLARSLVRAYGGPLTSTSANREGAPPAVNVVQVTACLGDSIDCIVDGGETPGGPGSTLVAAGDAGLVLIRPGIIPFADILRETGLVAGAA